MQEMTKSGLVSTLQNWRHVGQNRKITQFRVPKPSLEQAHEQEAVEDRREIQRHRQRVVADDPGVEHHPDHEHGQEVGDELGQHRVERAHHWIGQEPAVRGDRLADRRGHVAEQEERG